MLTKAQGMQMSPLKSQMAFGLFHSALFDKTPPKSTKKLSSCTGDHSLPASFLLLPFPSSFLLPFLSPQIRRAHKQKLKSGHFSLFTSSLPQPITVRTLIPTFTPGRDVSTMVQQAHRPSPYGGAAMVPFTNSKVCDIQVCIGDSVP